MTVARFMDVLGTVEPGDCWLWPQAVDKYGYGKVHIVREDGRKSTVVPHRWFYEQVIRPVPEGFELDHAWCQTRHCVNPAHLEEVTRLENMRRGANAMRTHCKRGHSLANAYIYVSKRSGHRHRQCRTCAREWQRVHYQRKQELQLNGRN